MMPLCWCVLLLCVSASADENIVASRASGQSVTFKCSSAGCPNSIEGYTGMYLYWDFKERKEVLFWNSQAGPTDEISPRGGYENRIQINGSLKNHTITISNLTMHDSGLYSCVYTKFPKIKVDCQAHLLLVSDRRTHTGDDSNEGGAMLKSKEPDVPQHLLSEVSECQSPPLPLIVIATGAISMLVTVIFILLILPRVKQWTCSRRPTKALQVSNDYVYEVMTKSGLRPVDAPEHSEPSPYDFA
ncbi:uncharacterized protein LOC143320144 [Chaetodon auriga]|uniref:uncharacterized protein LOC143320144 n=1 Tax=Chaetodon auriga TaxID=39042 RepID=UPI004032FFEB